MSGQIIPLIMSGGARTRPSDSAFAWVTNWPPFAGAWGAAAETLTPNP
jgi:hypothetical protein